MINHKAEAERIMSLAHDNADQGNEWRSDHQMKRAQVHATLHLAEMQRIANEQGDAMIEVARAAVVLAGTPFVAAPGYGRAFIEEVHPDVARLLGLGGEGDE